MTIDDVVQSLRRFWPLVLGVLGLFLVIGIAAAYLPQERYRASALMFVEPASARSLEFGARESLDLLVPSIVEQVKTRRFDNAVKAAASRDIGDATLSAASEPGTGVLIITGESTNPQLAAVAANAAAAELTNNPLSTAVKFSTLDPAYAPSAPSSPKRKPILLGCLILGAILAVFAAVAANTLRRRVAGAEAIRQGFGLTVLGEITRSRRLRTQPAALFRGGGPPEVVEEYQRLRTSFELLARDYRTVAVTSWTQGEGKTTVTANLGWMLAALGRHVTIADLDLRRPAAHVPFGLDLVGGVADLAIDSDRHTRSIARPKQTDLPELEVLTAGLLHGEPAKVIEEAFPAVQEMLEGRLVIVDTPPLLAAETALIASMVDALVIVIDVRRRDPSELEALLQVLKMTQTTILGVVLNNVRKSSRQRQISDYYAGPRQPPLQSVLKRR